MNGLTVGNGTNTFGRANSSARVTECINRLEAQLKKDMQDEMTASSVQVGTVTFISRSHTKAWMDLNKCPPSSP
jgi:hypothetical protein